MTDLEDIGFAEGAKKLLNINDQQVQELIDRLDTNDLTELANAITTGDKRKALVIYYASQDKKLPESVNSLNVGDLVYINKKKKGRVRIPNGPGNTVGVKIGKKMKMIDRDNISLTEAGVLGMTMLPGLARMQELAGLCPSGAGEDGVTAEVVDEPEDDHMTCVMNALAALEEALPNVTLKDVKVVRSRLNDILRTMNESASPKGRKLKD